MHHDWRLKPWQNMYCRTNKHSTGIWNAETSTFLLRCLLGSLLYLVPILTQTFCFSWECRAISLQARLPYIGTLQNDFSLSSRTIMQKIMIFSFLRKGIKQNREGRTLFAHSEIKWAGDVQNCTATVGHAVFLQCRLVTCHSTKQRWIADSSTEANTSPVQNVFKPSVITATLHRSW